MVSLPPFSHLVLLTLWVSLVWPQTSVTIFTVPGTNETQLAQKMAIASWLMLKPPPQVILLSSSGERARPELVDSHVEVLANVDLKGCAVVLCSLFSELDLVSAIQSISSVAKDDLVVYVPSPVVVQQAWLDNLLYLAEYFSSCGLQSFLISGETQKVSPSKGFMDTIAQTTPKGQVESLLKQYSDSSITPNTKIQYVAFNRCFMDSFTFPRVPVSTYFCVSVLTPSVVDGTFSDNIGGWPFWVSQLSDEQNLAFPDTFNSETMPDSRTFYVSTHKAEKLVFDVCIPLSHDVYINKDELWPALKHLQLMYRNTRFNPKTTLSCAKSKSPTPSYTPPLLRASRTITGPNAAQQAIPSSEDAFLLGWVTPALLSGQDGFAIFALLCVLWTSIWWYLDVVLGPLIGLVQHRQSGAIQTRRKDSGVNWIPVAIEGAKTCLVVVMSALTLDRNIWLLALSFGHIGSIASIDSFMISHANSRVTLSFSVFCFFAMIVTKYAYQIHSWPLHPEKRETMSLWHCMRLAVILALIFYCPPLHYPHVCFTVIYYETFSLGFHTLYTKITKENSTIDASRVLMLIEGLVYIYYDYLGWKLFTTFVTPPARLTALFTLINLMAVSLLIPLMLNFAPSIILLTIATVRYLIRGLEDLIEKLKRFFLWIYSLPHAMRAIRLTDNA